MCFTRSGLMGALSLALLLSGCDELAQYLARAGAGSSRADAGTSAPGALRPQLGATEFVSANPNAPVDRGDGDDTAPPTEPGDEASSAGKSGSASPGSPALDRPPQPVATQTRAVERGDIYRLLPEQRVLNLNTYRGVQIIDVRDVSQPRIEGRVAVPGSPVELYCLDGERAIVLLNQWGGYYGARKDVPVVNAEGGLILSIDLRDRTHPTIVDRVTLPGWISTSRLTQGGGGAALYVVLQSTQGGETSVSSFDVSQPRVRAASTLSFEGSVQDVQATDALLMVASTDYAADQARSRVSLVDISHSDGTMRAGGSVPVHGVVRSKFNMDVYQGVLRVVSEAQRVWPNGAGSGAPSEPSDQQHHLETFSLADLQHPQPLADCAFGDINPDTNQIDSLFATLFLDQRAFFVTYYRRDPFHAFSIDAQGDCQEHNQFIVSGWNDFFRATHGGTRLLGVGHDDASGSQQLAVSLYDAQNLDNTAPLLARASIALPFAASEANWDDRAFTILEGAVVAASADGVAETGLLLLPFQGYDPGTKRYTASTQLFTFSDHTLTRRGVLEHGEQVRRAFATGPSTMANLSDQQLRLFDTASPDKPRALGRVELAADYARLFVFGEHVVRVKRDVSHSELAANAADDELQVLARAGDLEDGPVLSSFRVPGDSDLIRVDDLLIATQTTLTNPPSADSTELFTPHYVTSIAVHDLSDPLHPRRRGSLETDRLALGGMSPISCRGDVCWVGGVSPVPGGNYHVVPGAIAFLHFEQHQESLSNVHVCDTYSPAPPCTANDQGTVVCTPPRYIGGISCVTRAGLREVCSGSFMECNESDECQPLSTPPAGVVQSCYDYEDFNFWQSYAFDVLDLRDPDHPALAARVDTAPSEHASTAFTDGSTVYYNFSEPFTVQGDSTAFIKKYVRELDLTNPAAPALGAPLNVPGEVFAVSGGQLYALSQDATGSQTRSYLDRLTRSEHVARLEASRTFSEQQPSELRLVEGRLFATLYVVDGAVLPQAEPVVTLGELDATNLSTLGEAVVDAWASLGGITNGRAWLNGPGGVLIFDLPSGAPPSARAYHGTLGWSATPPYFDGAELLIAHGLYGITRIDASVHNLLGP